MTTHYSSITDVEQGNGGEDAPLSSKAVTRRKVLLGVAILGMAALAGFAAGTATTGTESTTSALANKGAGSSTYTDPAYIVQNCFLPAKGWSGNHIEYFTDPFPGREGWYCSYKGKGLSTDDDEVWNWVASYAVGDDGKAYHVKEWDDDKYWLQGLSEPFYYDYAEIHGACDKAAFHQDYFGGGYGAWRCLDEPDFQAKSLSAPDLTWFANTAAIATYASFPDGVDLYNEGGGFNLHHQNHAIIHSINNANAPADRLYGMATEGDDWKLWRDGGRHPGGYFLVKKQCNDDKTCYLNFVCTKDDTADVLWDNC